MKRYHAILICIVALCLSACFGGNSKPVQPAHLTSGMRQIKKGSIWYHKGCYQRALEHFLRAHELFASSDQQSGVAISLNNIGNVYRIIGNNEEAMLFFNESYGIYTDISNYEGIVHVLSNKAAALIDSGSLEAAMDMLNKAERIAQTNDIYYNPLLRNRGVLLIRKKEYDQAEVILNKALTHVVPPNHSESAAIHSALGKLMLETKKFDSAIEHFQSALEADRLTGFYKGMADDLAAIGFAYFTQERYELAANFYRRSIKIYAMIGDESNVQEIMNLLDRAAESTGLDIRITQEFVKRWQAGEADNPCD